MSFSRAEEDLAIQLTECGYDFEREVRFHLTRRWRLDFVVNINGQPLAIEVEGITPGYGRHQRVAGFEKDCEKYVSAVLHGYTVVRFSQKMVRNGAVVKFLDKYSKLFSAS